MLYFFILGHNFILSIAEILSLLQRKKISFTIKEQSKEALVLETSISQPSNFQKELGGTIKIGKIIDFFDKKEFEKIFSLALESLSSKRKKVYFGFSLYSLEEETSLKKFDRLIKSLALKIKKELKSKNISSRWVSSTNISLSSVVVRKNKLNQPKRGIEFVILAKKNKFYLGESLSVQDFSQEKYFDFGRPSRPIKSGLVPPKLARILINLSQAKKEDIILDPFCGAGTILGEAIRQGYKNIIGADISKKAIKQTQENLNWLFKQIKQEKKYQLILSDVRNISEKIPQESIGAIISEPYLGPIKIKNQEEEIKKIIKELSDLYFTSFREFKKILKPKGKVVIVSPVFILKKKKYFLPLKHKLKNQGWQIINPLEKTAYFSSPLIYCQPNQKIWREILIFQK